MNSSTFMKALALQGKNVVEYIICPKAMSRDWLLGHIEHDTRQWTDGVISYTALEISNQPSGKHSLNTKNNT